MSWSSGSTSGAYARGIQQGGGGPGEGFLDLLLTDNLDFSIELIKRADSKTLFDASYKQRIHGTAIILTRKHATVQSRATQIHQSQKLRLRDHATLETGAGTTL